jgi:pyridinium-3,5-biscarboxylic acid mononucleotide sulfurtransferase
MPETDAASPGTTQITLAASEIGSPVEMAIAHAKLSRIRALLGTLESVVVAFSGGVDSTLVLKIAVDALGQRAIAVIAVSASLPTGELEAAEAVARGLGIRLHKLETSEIDNSDYQANTEARCYFCKRDVYAALSGFARQQGIKHVLDGLNLDDLSDRRPGRKAAEEAGVRSPLAEVGLSKAEVRELSRAFGLPTWDKPSMACLSSRIPYGKPVTRQALAQIDRAEQVVRGVGIRQVRVRHHDGLARIEIDPADFAILLAHRELIVRGLRELGYDHVTLDLLGYRSGSLNEVRR